MYIDARLAYRSLAEVEPITRWVEDVGFDGLWSSEVDHDPFLGLALAAAHSKRITLGTSIALAFTRSPTTLAYTAWDLAELSGGRFVLGLGTQVKGHITRRFGMPWDPPAPKLREVIGAIRAVWASWIERRPLQFKGRYFTLSLMTPFFTPPEPTPAALRIEVAGVGGRMCRLAGEVADGFHVHAFHTRRYLREVVMPQIQAGLDRSGRGRDAFSVSAGVFAAIGTEADVAAGLQEIRRHFAFYASTPTYRPVLNLHGWGEVGEQLSRHAARGEWEAMPGLITDEMMEAAALWGPPDEVADRLLAEYRGLVDRVAIYERVGVYEFTVSARREGVYRTLLDRVRAGSQRAG